MVRRYRLVVGVVRRLLVAIHGLMGLRLLPVPVEQRVVVLVVLLVLGQEEQAEQVIPLITMAGLEGQIQMNWLVQVVAEPVGLME